MGFIKNNRNAIYGGIAATCFTGLGVFLVGNVSGYEAKNLLEVSLSGLNMLCNTIVLASATILALLLTLLSVSIGSTNSLKKRHYFQVLHIAKFDVILFISALILFQFFNIPIMESNEVPTSWYVSIYWITLGASSLISGMMITVILLLYNAVTNIIAIVGLGKEHELISTQDTSENSAEEQEKMKKEA
ncbi:hypothetical protein ESY86_06945 [Subsaximicrobium wynnwilliamsii]|uniref:Uncharacterized protein n=1 Tax=Subsaximicrobium wynnwilliamsii TaxID=291179 RepID=A0A5C6ZJJ4_9FLAO|nr:hypothetical protein [Subsaximicrobium wynnwilliamsii]TXD81567.1 hypothetical protein ESY87_17560 [Subsaximicrobium wynnwilliamsii]TXD89929.1 hypothetical protein ESY86_06945 [Subsaximicrobium wynnwilliamsii]TXE01028.1 hypothetical protein ESY88_17555 [Subsaximicrobium wynnwilliamsii]